MQNEYLWDPFSTFSYVTHLIPLDPDILSTNRLRFRTNRLNECFLLLLSLLDQDSPLWFFARTFFLTASKILSALGMKIRMSERYISDGFGTPLQTWKYCVNMEKEVFEENKHTIRGKTGEPIIRMMYETIMNVKVTQSGLHVSKTCHYIAASPDGLISKDDQKTESAKSWGNGGLEIKYPSHTDGTVRTDYYVQVQVNMECCDRNWWDLCIYADTAKRIGRLYIYRVYRCSEYWEWLKKGIDYFVTCVEFEKEPIESEMHCFSNNGEPKQRVEKIVDNALVIDMKEIYLRSLPNQRFRDVMTSKQTAIIVDSLNLENFIRAKHGLPNKRVRKQPEPQRQVNSEVNPRTPVLKMNVTTTRK
jgi:hypothetical protein